MEEWIVIGIKPNHQFKGNDGEMVHGKLLFLAKDAEQGDGIEGQIVREQFVSDRVKLDVRLADAIVIYFNRYGRIHSIEVKA